MLRYQIHSLVIPVAALRRRSTASRLFGFRVRIALGECVSVSFESCVLSAYVIHMWLAYWPVQVYCSERWKNYL